MRNFISVLAVPLLATTLLASNPNLKDVKAQEKIKNHSPRTNQTMLLAQRQLNSSFFTSRKWRFGRGNGSTIASSIRLLPDGSVEGYHNPNEDHWGIEGMTFVFYNPNNIAVTRFNTIRREPNGKWVVIGSVVGEPSIVHVLTEIP
jgi:hypothetical protein